MTTYISKSENDTISFAKNFAKDLIYKEIDANNIGEIFYGVISIIILMIII